MKIKKAQFIQSSPNLKSAPAFDLSEIALLGRSNAGKSTFINLIANMTSLAKTSNTPGKTRLINHFEFLTDTKSFIIADLPGYGYAKVSKSTQAQWANNLEEYLLKRENLAFCIQFIDSRRGLLENDIQMVDWLKINGVSFINILTKCDLVKQSRLSSVLCETQKFTKTECFPFSSKKPYLKDKILDYISFNIN